jgi:glyoxylase-like metal-dependent hydrolase (beta-lactamase superfamily II)
MRRASHCSTACESRRPKKKRARRRAREWDPWGLVRGTVSPARAMPRARAENRDCIPGRLKLILLTHGDNDHAANARYIGKKYNAPIAMHKNDLELVDNPSFEKLMESYKYRSFIFKVVFIFMKKLIKKVTAKILDDFESFKPDIFINEGDSLQKYGFDAKIIHIPGHTAGSVGILAANGDLISGDVFINNGKPDSSPNAVDFKLLNKSVSRLKSMNNDIGKIYPGHGEPFEFKQLLKG